MKPIDEVQQIELILVNGVLSGYIFGNKTVLNARIESKESTHCFPVFTHTYPDNSSYKLRDDGGLDLYYVRDRKSDQDITVLKFKNLKDKKAFLSYNISLNT